MAGVKQSSAILINREAQQHLQRKVNALRYSWQDTKAHEHAVAFTVAKMMDEDLLAETRAAVQAALDNGTDFAAFKKRLKPYLMARGWWGQALMGDPLTGQIHRVQLGSTRRLRTIYHTNLHTAYAAGQWERIQANKDTLPYLKYIGSDAAEPREAHKPFYGLILPVDDPFWKTHMPPNGWGCRCNVRALTKAQAEREGGVSPSPKLNKIERINTRTGEIDQYPAGVDPSFAHNPGDRMGALVKIAADKHGVDFADKLLDELAVLYAPLPAAEHWPEVAKIGKDIWDKHADILENIDFDADNAFASAIAEVMAREGVETGAKVLAKGDDIGKFVEIINRYPASWVSKANAAGTVYVRSLDSRGYHIHLDDATAGWMRKYSKYNKDYKIFAKFADDLSAGDSLLKLNNMRGKTITSAARDVAIHEYAHRLQAVMPELDEYFKQMWITRTKGEKDRHLGVIEKESGLTVHKWQATERGRKDHFANVYIGKNYGTDDNPRPLEVMTMTFEAILGSGRSGGISVKKLLDDDPEMLYLGIALLTRFKP